MRYMNIPTLTFTASTGRKLQVKDMREPPTYDTLTMYFLKKTDEIDEIASRKEYFGEGTESLSYAIIDANKISFMENQFDVSKISSIIIPAVS